MKTLIVALFVTDSKGKTIFKTSRKSFKPFSVESDQKELIVKNIKDTISLKGIKETFVYINYIQGDGVPTLSHPPVYAREIAKEVPYQQGLSRLLKKVSEVEV